MTEQNPIGKLSRIALTAIALCTASVALTALPFANVAMANNGGGKGGDHGNGHGKGGDKSKGNAGGNSNASNGNGNGNGGTSGGPSKSTVADSDDDPTQNPADATADPSLSPSGLGKLNGFMHASPNALANASPNSSIGIISKTFSDALKDFTSAQTPPADPNAPPADPTAAPSVEDLGGILAGATNKEVTAGQVKAIADKLADTTGDPSLGDLSDEDAQGIADAANAANDAEADDTATTSLE